ncbi:ABC transporter substrate-binding protein [Frankia sp. CNm7]|uniref:ABC transporter substrate-binding protein n=1 Tax=Frankia nepalensis TaxID=1836974 RepID=A0A937US76_9ACTN|nr:ABC transporter substrate-binding protein [Frankia nepalensis]MBL7499484.1 ABC transporter substrate-binding protein [Frankia nepalensis]MBL7515361.1 ABC transporter substrate-binding protein [Frankia nepalensis]MBL7523078.1 ABC transporter substrate-binding protein [Frankia nepalensis]MBL7631858.1 ABC transporter substrate-binding protein [Frankia nepalensis]
MRLRRTGTATRRTRVAALLVPLLFAGAGLAACGGGDDDGGEPAAGGGLEAPRTVTVGLITAQTGPAAAAYKPLEDAAKAAIDYLNSGKAKASNVTYKLEIRDSAADPNRATILVRELISAGATAIVGDIASSPGFIAEQTTLNREEIIGFTSTPADVIWKDAGAGGAYPWAFGISGDDTMFVTPEYEAAAGRTANGKIAQIYLDQGSVPGWAKLASDMAEKDGKTLSTVSFAANATDVKAQLREAQDSGADTLIVWAYGAPLQTVLSNLDQVGWYPNVVTLPDAARSSLQQAVPAKVMDLVVSGPITATFVSKDGAAPTGIVADYLAAMTKVTGRGPGEYGQADISGAYTFDMLVAYDAAVAKAGSTDSAKVRAALESGMEVEGAMGVHTWGPDERSGLEATSFALFDPQESCGKGTCVGVPTAS